MNDADRIEKTILKLKDLLYIKTFSMNNFTKKDGAFTSIEEVDSSYSPWQICGKNSYWGKNSTFAWFRFEFKIPNEFKERPIILKVKSEDIDSQFIVYVNKVLKFHLLENGEALIKEAAEEIVDFKIDISAIVKSSIENDRQLKCYLIVVDEFVKEYLFYLIQTLYIVRRTDRSQKLSSYVISILNKSIDMLNLEESYSEEFDISIFKALNFLKDEFSAFKKENNLGKRVNCNFLIPANLNSIVILNNLYLASTNVFNYKLTLTSIKDLVYIKKTYPNVFSDIKEKVRSGKFELVVGINSNRENSYHGETLIRNIIFKKKFFLEEFNDDINIILFNSGNYLYASIPKILNDLRIKYAFFEEKNIVNVKRIFTWIGINKDKVNCGIYRDVNDNISFKNILNIHEVEKQEDKNIPLISCFSSYELDKLKLETLIDVSNSITLTPVINLYTFKEESENIKSILSDELNCFKCFGDLNSHDYNTNNVKSETEVLVQSAEVWSVFDYLQGNEYDIETLNNCWLNMDDEDYIKKMTEGVLCDIRDKICQNITSPYYTIVVFNNVSFLRDEVVEFNYYGNFSEKVIKDGHGNLIPHQISKDREKIFFLAHNLPPFGYKCFYIVDGIGEEETIFEDKLIIESNTVKLCFDESGNIISLFDKVNDKQLILPTCKCNYIEVSEENPLNSNKKTKVDFEIDPIEIIESGTVKSSIKIRKILNDSCFEQIISVYHDILKVDFKTKIYLNDFYDIKAKFEFDINSPRYISDMPFGVSHKTAGNLNINRKKSWISIYEDNYKIQITNNKNCDMEVLGNAVTLMLATSKSPSVIDVDYSLYLELSYGYENMVKNGYTNLSPIHICEVEFNKPQDPLPYMISMGWIDNDNVILQTLKKAENSDEIVIRAYEIDNKETECIFSFYRIIYDVYESDMLEREIKKLENDGNKFKFNIKPHEIKTFKFKVQI